MIAAILLGVGTITGWFRADILVRNRTARPGTGSRRSEKLSPAQNERERKRVGAMTFFCLRFGLLALTIIMTILLIQWFAMGLFNSGLKLLIISGKSQIGLMTMLTVFMMHCSLLGQLRVLRTVPIKTSALTNWLLFWPLGLAMITWLMAQLLFSLLNGSPIEWNFFGQTMIGAISMAILLPLTLRFGLKVWAILPVMMFAAIASSAGRFMLGGLSEVPASGWIIGSVVFLVGIWWITYRLLGSHYPWRANAMKGLVAARRM
jgi:hypothetical protein